LNWPKVCLPKLKKSQIKYCSTGFEIWNNLPYGNFSIFEEELELEFREVKSLLNSIKIYLNIRSSQEFVKLGQSSSNYI
jgi:hypothetical protein